MNTPLPHSLPWKADQAISGCPIIVSNQGDHIANVYCQDDRDYILDAVNGRTAIEQQLEALMESPNGLFFKRFTIAAMDQANKRTMKSGSESCSCPSVACPIHGLPKGSACGGW